MQLEDGERPVLRTGALLFCSYRRVLEALAELDV